MSAGRHRSARAFGQALKAARVAKGLSQEQLAEGAQFDPTYVSLLERGLRTPTLSVLIDIGYALDMEPQQLVSATIDKLGGDSS